MPVKRFPSGAPEKRTPAHQPTDHLPMNTPSDNHHLLQDAVSRILQWYPGVRRPLPWRQSPTPYHVWISEIMLQQTRIEAVIPYYTRFLGELPDISALATVPDDRLLKLWEGLGYYSRARNLKKAAVVLARQYGGQLPASAEELKSLPGIGDYTAGAIASIAFGLPEPAVDGNVLRVIMRLTACPDDIAEQKTKRSVTEQLRDCYPSGYEAGLLTEGLMELGETVCLPNGAPRCDACPLMTLCKAHRDGSELSFPVKGAKKPRRVEDKTVLLLRRGNRFAIRKRPGTGLLAGLWEFPMLDGTLSPEEILHALSGPGLAVLDVAPCGKSKHIFTHIEWRMKGFLLDCENNAAETGICSARAGAENPNLERGAAAGTAFSDLLWLTPAEIAAEYPLPTAFRPWQKIISRI